MDFNFITDEHFRKSLSEDQRELQSGLATESWKSVHVLAGSIVEAVLTEYLVVSGVRPSGKDPLSMTLGEVVIACQNDGVLDKSTTALCEVVKDYRNLIHPGRMKRLQQQVTREGAHIASNLVTLIARAVAEKRKQTFGPTAEQILRKLESDQHALAVIPQLLRATKEHERLRLVKSLLPDACLNLSQAPSADAQILASMREAYRRILDTVPLNEQVLIASKFAKMVREESSQDIEAYGESFFRCEDIRLLEANDAEITIKYLLNRIEQPLGMSDGLSRLLAGITQYVGKDILERFSDTLIRLVMRQTADNLGTSLLFVSGEFDSLDAEKKKILSDRIELRVKWASKRIYADDTKERLSRIESAWMDVPF